MSLDGLREGVDRHWKEKRENGRLKKSKGGV